MKYDVDIYFDVISPYSWVAFEALSRYSREWNINLHLKPFYLKKIMQSTGNKPPMMVPAKGMYMLKDLDRLNSFWGMELTPPANFAKWIKNPKTQDQNPMRLLVAVQLEHPDKVETVARELWKRIWTHGEPIFAEEDLKTVLKASGLDSKSEHFLSKLNEKQVVDLLNENSEKAIEQGAFGAPWIVVHKDGEEQGFFGSDRFSLIAHMIGEKFTDGKIQYSKL